MERHLEHLILLPDTGAAASLIALETVAESNYLSSLPIEHIEEKTFYAGDQGTLISKSMIRILVTTTEGFKLSLPVYVTENSTPRLMLFGYDVLSQLNAVLDVTHHKFYINRPTNYVELAEPLFLAPQEMINVTGKLYDGKIALHRRPVFFQSHNTVNQYVINSTLQFVDRLALLTCANRTAETPKLKTGNVMGFLSSHEDTMFVCTNVKTIHTCLSLFVNESPLKDMRNAIFKTPSRSTGNLHKRDILQISPETHEIEMEDDIYPNPHWNPEGEYKDQPPFQDFDAD